MIGLIGIIISLALLMYLAYKGWSVVLIAPFLGLLAVIFAGLNGEPMHLLATYTEGFMVSLGGYVKSYFPMFCLGAIFGKVMDASGSAQSIANWCARKLGHGKEVWAVVIACGIITYGGVSLFVAAFAIYPIGAAMFKEANLPKRLLPPAIALGAFTFTMTAIPGTPQIQNTIPMPFFGTDTFAAPILGIIAALIMFFGGTFWIQSRLKKAKTNGEGYGDHIDEITQMDESGLPSFGIAILPIIVVIVSSLIFSKIIFGGDNPLVDGSYLEPSAEEGGYGTTLSAVAGTWSVILALLLGVILTVVFNYKRFESGVVQTLKDGVQGSFLAIMNTASEVGYGNIIKTLGGFAVVAGFLTNLGSNPLIGEAISTSVLAGITGSASGGMSIALQTFGEQFLQKAGEVGIKPEVLHRVCSVASGGLDTMPHNGAVITLLAITGMTHGDCYPNIAMCTVVIPAIACIAIIILGSFGIA